MTKIIAATSTASTTLIVTISDLCAPIARKMPNSFFRFSKLTLKYKKINKTAISANTPPAIKHTKINDSDKKENTP